MATGSRTVYLVVFIFGDVCAGYHQNVSQGNRRNPEPVERIKRLKPLRPLGVARLHFFVDRMHLSSILPFHLVENSVRLVVAKYRIDAMRELIANLADGFERAKACVQAEGNRYNAMLASHLRALFDEAPILASKDAGAAAHGTAALVASFAGASATGREMIEQASASASLQTARRLIEANLREPDLGPEFVCQRLGMSRAKLYRLFEPIGGVGAYIQQRRLTRAYHALTDPAQANVYIGLVASQCGFGNASVFSRAFRQAFGISPTDLRANHRCVDADDTGLSGDNAFTTMRRQLLGMGSRHR